MKIHFLNHSRNGLEVHKPNCAHIEKAKRTRDWNNDWIEDLPDGPILPAAVKAMNESFGWVSEEVDGESAPSYDSAIRVMPCTKGIGK